MKRLAIFISKFITTKTVFILALIISVIVWYWSFSHNYVLTYNDAASHLNIARRIVDNYTPGLAQIGTVWLPLPHLAMLVFAWNDFLWKTALAGSLVSMSAYVVSVVLMYETILVITDNKIGSLIGSLVIALNPNFLYLQTTPMTEPLLICTFVMTIYFLAKFVKTQEMLYLILTGVAVMLSTLIRYDGWFLFIVLSGLIPLWSLIKHGAKRAEGEFLIFVIVGGLGIALWLLWNQAIFGDALYFLTGPYSAYAQQQVLKSVGQLPTAGNWFNAIYYYVWAAIDNNGLIIMVGSLISLFVVPFVLKNKSFLIVILAAISPFVFNILALYAGQSAMNIPQAMKDPGLFNIRYGIMALPVLALILGLVASRIKFIWLAVLGILVFQLMTFYKAGIPVALADGLNGLQQTYYTVEASKWLANNYKGGLILTSLASNDAFVARAHLNMKNYIQEGNSVYWDHALQKPSDNIKYVATLTFPPDRVWQRLKNNKDFLTNYVEIHSYKEFKIYERKW